MPTPQDFKHAIPNTLASNEGIWHQQTLWLLLCFRDSFKSNMYELLTETFWKFLLLQFLRMIHSRLTCGHAMVPELWWHMQNCHKLDHYSSHKSSIYLAMTISWAPKACFIGVPENVLCTSQWLIESLSKPLDVLWGHKTIISSICSHCDISLRWMPYSLTNNYPESKVNGANMGPTWVLSAPHGPHVGPMNLVIRVINTGSGNTSVLSGNTPLPEQMLTKSMLQYGITRPQCVKMSFCLDGGNEIMPAWMCICTQWKLDVATVTNSTAHVKSLAELSHCQIYFHLKIEHNSYITFSIL